MEVSTVGSALSFGAGFLGWAVRGRSSTLLAPSIWRGTKDRSVVALTFDDGPSESTPELLAILAAHGARATFFQCGRNVRRTPSIAREVVLAGHEIGNHTESHAPLWLRSPSFIREELAQGQRSIEETTGIAPRWFRPPYGVRWFGLREAQRQCGLTGIMWTVLGLDWKRPASEIVERVLLGARNGAIVCLHDGRGLTENPEIGETILALKRFMPVLRDKGYHFETISQILCPTS